MVVNGTVFKYGDNVDTDVIIPARYLNAPSPEELAKHCMEDIDASYASQVKPGDIMVGGWNFGCGSSREYVMLLLKEAKISCVIAKSFARAFYRSSINQGILPIECDLEVEEGDMLTVHTDSGIILVNGEREYSYQKLPFLMDNIVMEGGLIPYYLHHGL